MGRNGIRKRKQKIKISGIISFIDDDPNASVKKNSRGQFMEIPLKMAQRFVNDVKNRSYPLRYNHSMKLPAIGRIKGLKIVKQEVKLDDGVSTMNRNVLVMDAEITNQSFINSLQMSTDYYNSEEKPGNFISPDGFLDGNMDVDYGNNVYEVSARDSLFKRYRGLSIGHHFNKDYDIAEVSICRAGARPGTILTDTEFTTSIPDDESNKIESANEDEMISYLAAMAAKPYASVIDSARKITTDAAMLGVENESLQYALDSENKDADDKPSEVVSQQKKEEPMVKTEEEETPTEVIEPVKVEPSCSVCACKTIPTNNDQTENKEESITTFTKESQPVQEAIPTTNNYTMESKDLKALVQGEQVDDRKALQQASLSSFSTADLERTLKNRRDLELRQKREEDLLRLLEAEDRFRSRSRPRSSRLERDFYDDDEDEFLNHPSRSKLSRKRAYEPSFRDQEDDMYSSTMLYQRPRTLKRPRYEPEYASEYDDEEYHAPPLPRKVAYQQQAPVKRQPAYRGYPQHPQQQPRRQAPPQVRTIYVDPVTGEEYDAPPPQFAEPEPVVNRVMLPRQTAPKTAPVKKTVPVVKRKVAPPPQPEPMEEEVEEGEVVEEEEEVVPQPEPVKKVVKVVKRVVQQPPPPPPPTPVEPVVEQVEEPAQNYSMKEPVYQGRTTGDWLDLLVTQI